MGNLGWGVGSRTKMSLSFGGLRCLGLLDRGLEGIYWVFGDEEEDRSGKLDLGIIY